MTISHDSKREIARCKREMFSAGKGDAARIGSVDKYVNQYPECSVEGCYGLKQKGSNMCRKHTMENK